MRATYIDDDEMITMSALTNILNWNCIVLAR